VEKRGEVGWRQFFIFIFILPKLLDLLSFWFPPGRGNLDWEVGWGEEREDHGGDVVAAVEHALVEKFNGLGVGWSPPGVFWEGHVVSLVDDVENEVEDGGEGCASVLSAGGDSNRVVFVGRNNVVGIGRDGELVGVEFLLESVLELESLSIPDLHRFVVTSTHKNTPVGGV